MVALWTDHPLVAAAASHEAKAIAATQEGKEGLQQQQKQAQEAQRKEAIAATQEGKEGLQRVELQQRLLRRACIFISSRKLLRVCQLQKQNTTPRAGKT